MEIFEYIRIFEYIGIFEYIRIFFLQYEYIRIRIRIEIALTNIFVFVFGPEKNIRSPLVCLSVCPPKITKKFQNFTKPSKPSMRDCYDRRRPLMEDDLWRKTTFEEDDLWRKTTFDRRRPLTDDGLWWKTTFHRVYSISPEKMFMTPHLDSHSRTDLKL